MVLRYAIFLSNLILHSDSVCDILRSIVDISESRRVWVNTLFIKVAEYYLLDTLPKVEPIKVDSQLKTIDIMHFGWNIGKAFGKPRLQTATFIKKVFAHTLRDSEISTIERKMSHTESGCKIKLNKQIQ